MTRFDDAAAAVERFRRTADQRRQVKASLDTGHTPVEIDSPERAERHLAYLGVSLKPADVVREAEAERRRGERPNLERIIGRDNLQSVLFLTKGAARARAVGAIGARDNIFGTGFLIAPGILLTNNHVLENEADAEASFVSFNFEDSLDGGVGPEHRFALRPQDLFLTSVDLDYTIVAVELHAVDGKDLAEFGYIPLSSTPGKVLLGEPLNVIQHPNGARKQVAIRENRFTALLDAYLHYETDTNPGSSGSPVFNDMWDVVALHHSVVPQTDENGQFIGNEGVRISVILSDIAERADEATQLAIGIPPRVASADERRRRPREVRPGSLEDSEQGATFDIAIQSPAGEIRLPVTISIDVRPLQASLAAGAAAASPSHVKVAAHALGSVWPVGGDSSRATLGTRGR